MKSFFSFQIVSETLLLSFFFLKKNIYIYPNLPPKRLLLQPAPSIGPLHHISSILVWKSYPYLFILPTSSNNLNLTLSATGCCSMAKSGTSKPRLVWFATGVRARQILWEMQLQYMAREFDFPFGCLSSALQQMPTGRTIYMVF